MTDSLLELALQARNIAQRIEVLGGEIDEALDLIMPLNELSLAEKVDRYKYVLDALDGQSDIWNRRTKECREQCARYDSLQEKLRDRLKVAMNILETDELKGHVYRFKLTKSVGRLVISDETKIPEQYKMVVTTSVVDKEKIKTALKDGITVPGCELINEGSLRTYASKGDT